jgi:hypothetical protein
MTYNFSFLIMHLTSSFATKAARSGFGALDELPAANRLRLLDLAPASITFFVVADAANRVSP